MIKILLLLTSAGLFGGAFFAARNGRWKLSVALALGCFLMGEVIYRTIELPKYQAEQAMQAQVHVRR